MANKKESTGLKAAIIFLAVLVLLILFLINSDKIVSNLKQTQFFERVFGKGSTPEFIKDYKPKSDKKGNGNGLLQVQVEPQKLQEPELISQTAETNENNKKTVSSEIQNNENNQSIADSNSVSEENASDTVFSQEKVNTDSENTVSEEKNIERTDSVKNKTSAEETYNPTKTIQKTEPATSIAKITTVSLYFVTIDAAGSVNRKKIERKIPYTNIPLTRAINSLLEGPSLEESDKGNMTLIPKGTKLISASVKNGVAYLNFNDKFEFNSVGVEGYLGQLQQIVFTATAFSTVNSVQILIENEKKDYLGSEGVWIGTPLTRNSFD